MTERLCEISPVTYEIIGFSLDTNLGQFKKHVCSHCPLEANCVLKKTLGGRVVAVQTPGIDASRTQYISQAALCITG